MHELPEVATRRAELGDVTNTTAQPAGSQSSEVPPPCEAVTSEQPAEPSEQLQAPAVDLVKQWASESFTSATGVRVELPALAVLYQETNGLLINAKQATSELFVMKKFKTLVCRSPERPDLALSQEEALGWLLAYARGRLLLDHEARPIGKYAGTQAAAAKKLLDGVRDAVKSRKSKARTKGASPEELAAMDAKAAQDSAAIREAEFKLKHMPAANTVIVERRVAKPAICQGCYRAVCSDPPSPLQARFGRPCPCIWGPDVQPEDPQPTSKGAVARAHAEWDMWSRFPEAGMAIAVVDQLENLYTWHDEGGAHMGYDDDLKPIKKPITQQQIDAQTQHCKLALERLRAVVPEISPVAFVCEPCLADEHNSMPCPYGFGRLPKWPWGLHLEPLGFCGVDCSCEVLREGRARVVTASLGAWPDVCVFPW